MTLRSADHTVSVYRRGPAGVSADGRELRSWDPVASGLQFSFGRGGGSVEQQPFGRVSNGRYPAHAETGKDIRVDDGIRLTASTITSAVGRRFLVRSATDFGARGELQMEIEDTHEAFG